VRRWSPLSNLEWIGSLKSKRLAPNFQCTCWSRTKIFGFWPLKKAVTKSGWWFGQHHLSMLWEFWAQKTLKPEERRSLFTSIMKQIMASLPIVSTFAIRSVKPLNKLHKKFRTSLYPNSGSEVLICLTEINTAGIKNKQVKIYLDSRWLSTWKSLKKVVTRYRNQLFTRYRNQLKTHPLKWKQCLFSRKNKYG
jgi:hypothetical protein